MGKANKNQGKSVVEQVIEVAEQAWLEPESEIPQAAVDAQEERYLDQLFYWQGVQDAELGVEPNSFIEARLAQVQANRNESKLLEAKAYAAKLQHDRATREAAVKGLAGVIASKVGGTEDEAMAKARELIAKSTPESLRQLADQVLADRQAQIKARQQAKATEAGQGLAAGATARVPKVGKKPADAASALDRRMYGFLRALEDGSKMSKNRANGGLFVDLELAEGEALELFKAHPVGKTMGSKWSAFCWHLEYAGGKNILRVDKVYTKDVNGILSAYLAKDAAAKGLGHEVSTNGEVPEGLLIPQEQVDAVLALKKA